MNQGEMVTSFSFVEDLLSKRVMRFLLMLEIAAMILVLALSFLAFFFLALVISLLTLLLLVGALHWLYARYKGLPVIREKREIERLSLKFRNRIQTEEKNIQAAIKGRGDLFQAEKEEVNQALWTLQKNHIEMGLVMASLQEVTIPGITQKLRERLAQHNIWTAADVTERIVEVPGFGGEKGQALLEWRRSVLHDLENTKPTSLPEKQTEAIQAKYSALQDQNNAAHRQALASRQMLEYELISFRERLKQLAPFTFLRYLSRSLASRGLVAVPLVFVLVLTQVISSVSATASTAFAMMASSPTLTASPTHTSVPAATLNQASTQTSTATVAPTQTSTSIQVPTLTSIPAPTHPAPTLTIPPSDTAIIPVSGGNCDPSYPTVCIPPPPPDLDCKDISYKRFKVFPPDPHGFDRDGDGVGCES